MLSTEVLYDHFHACEYGDCGQEAEYAVRDLEDTGCRPKAEYFSCPEHLEPTRNLFHRRYEFHRSAPLLTARSVYAMAKDTRRRIVVVSVEGDQVRWRLCESPASLSASYQKLHEYPSSVFGKTETSDTWVFLRDMAYFGYEKLLL